MFVSSLWLATLVSAILNVMVILYPPLEVHQTHSGMVKFITKDRHVGNFAIELQVIAGMRGKEEIIKDPAVLILLETNFPDQQQRQNP
jgi:hypothetical protein